MKHGYGSAWIVYYCAICEKYFMEGSGHCELCDNPPDPDECCHFTDMEVEVNLKCTNQ